MRLFLWFSNTVIIADRFGIIMWMVPHMTHVFKAISGWTTRRLLRHHDTMLLHINTVLILMASFYRVGKIVPPLMIQVSCRTVKQMFSPAFSLVWLISFRALSLDKWFVLIPWCPKFHGSKALYVSNIYDFGYLLALIQPFWFISVW